MIRNCGVIIQCHLKSNRLKNKILLPFGDTTILENVVAACCKSSADKVILATSTDINNDRIVDWYNKRHRYPALHLYRYYGDDGNLLARHYFCAKEYNLDTIIRITSDCPLHSSQIIDLCIKSYFYNKVDYLSFLSIDGMDTEIFSFKVLEDAYMNAKEPYQLEHCTPYIREQSHIKKARLEDFKLSIDTEQDLKRIREQYN